jgi:hypothetical protein
MISIYLGQTASPMQARLLDGAEYLRAREAPPAVAVAGVVLSVLSLPTSAEVTDIAVRPMCSPHPA